MALSLKLAFFARFQLCVLSNWKKELCKQTAIILYFIYKICFSSLDVEGAEFQILKTIPFNDVDIKVINIEVERIGAIFPGTYEHIEKYLESMGYELHTKISNFDAIFVKKGFSDEINEL